MLKQEEVLQKALVRYVLEGKAGSGVERQQYLGDRYQLAQDGINKINTAVKEFFASFDDEWGALVKMFMGIKN